MFLSPVLQNKKMYRNPLRRMPNTTPGAAALLPCIWHPAGGQEISEKMKIKWL